MNKQQQQALRRHVSSSEAVDGDVQVPPPQQQQHSEEDWSIRTVPTDEEVEKTDDGDGDHDETKEIEDDLQSLVGIALETIEKATQMSHEDAIENSTLMASTLGQLESQLMATALSAIEKATFMQNSSSSTNLDGDDADYDVSQRQERSQQLMASALAAIEAAAAIPTTDDLEQKKQRQQQEADNIALDNDTSELKNRSSSSPVSSPKKKESDVKTNVSSPGSSPVKSREKDETLSSPTAMLGLLDSGMPLSTEKISTKPLQLMNISDHSPGPQDITEISPPSPFNDAEFDTVDSDVITTPSHPLSSSSSPPTKEETIENDSVDVVEVKPDPLQRARKGLLISDLTRSTLMNQSVHKEEYIETISEGKKEKEQDMVEKEIHAEPTEEVVSVPSEANDVDIATETDAEDDQPSSDDIQTKTQAASVVSLEEATTSQSIQNDGIVTSPVKSEPSEDTFKAEVSGTLSNDTDSSQASQDRLLQEINARIKSIYTGNFHCVETVGSNSPPPGNPRLPTGHSVLDPRQASFHAELQTKVTSMFTHHHHIVESRSYEDLDILQEDKQEESEDKAEESSTSDTAPPEAAATDDNAVDDIVRGNSTESIESVEDYFNLEEDKTVTDNAVVAPAAPVKSAESEQSADIDEFDKQEIATAAEESTLPVDDESHKVSETLNSDCMEEVAESADLLPLMAAKSVEDNKSIEESERTPAEGVEASVVEDMEISVDHEKVVQMSSEAPVSNESPAPHVTEASNTSSSEPQSESVNESNDPAGAVEDAKNVAESDEMKTSALEEVEPSTLDEGDVKNSLGDQEVQEPETVVLTSVTSILSGTLGPADTVEDSNISDEKVLSSVATDEGDKVDSVNHEEHSTIPTTNDAVVDVETSDGTAIEKVVKSPEITESTEAGKDVKNQAEVVDTEAFAAKSPNAPRPPLMEESPQVSVKSASSKGKKWKERLANKKALKSESSSSVGKSSKKGSTEGSNPDESVPLEKIDTGGVPLDQIQISEENMVQGMPSSKGKKWKDRLAKKRGKKSVDGEEEAAPEKPPAITPVTSPAIVSDARKSINGTVSDTSQTTRYFSSPLS